MRKLLCIVFLLISTFVFSQEEAATDSVEKHINSLTQQLETYEKLLQENNEKRKQDSLARVDLFKRIQLLQESDKVNQATLREQIRAIEERDSIRKAKQRARAKDLRNSTKAFIIAPLGDSLFSIYTKLGPAMAEDRAKNVTQKIEQFVSDDFFYEDSLTIVSQGGTIDVVYSDLIVTSVSDWDVLWVEGISKDSLAVTYKGIISEYVLKTRNRSSVQNIAARIGLVFLTVGVVIALLFFIGKLSSGIQGWMMMNKKKYFNGIRVRGYELLPPEIHLELSIGFISTLKWGLYILTFYLSLPFVFGLFPFTKGWAQTLLDWVLEPAESVWYGFWDYIPNIFTIAVIYLVTRYIIKLLRFISNEIQSGRLHLPGFYDDWAMPTYRLAKLLIYAFMLVMIWPYLPGSDSDIFKGVAIFIGLLISLTVPNSSILTGHTINYSSISKKLVLIFNTTVKIRYDVPWNKVHELLIEAAVMTDGVNISREPFVLQTKLNDHTVSYQLKAYSDDPDRIPNIYSELHANIQDKFSEANIDFTSSNHTVKDQKIMAKAKK